MSLFKEPLCYTELDTVKNIYRKDRAELFKAFDIYKTNVIYGLIEENESEKQEVLDWYNFWLNLPDVVTEENMYTINILDTPTCIAKYIL